MNKIQMGGLWPTRSGNGWTGRFDNRLHSDQLELALREGWKIGVFKNNDVRNDKSPEYVIVLMEPISTRAAAQRLNPSEISSQRPSPALDDELPF